MKKAGIVTINDNDNYGNRLQNYAVQQVLKSNGLEDIKTIKNDVLLNLKTGKIECILRYIKFILLRIKKIRKRSERERCFLEFNKNIEYSSRTFSLFNNELKKYDYLIAGSDQIWNPTFGRLRDFDLLNLKTDAKRISFSASFGINELPKEHIEKTKKALSNFDMISVRENNGKKIINNMIEEKEVEVLIDPTMMLSAEQWDKVAVKPKQLKCDKYILNYFLGNLSEERKKTIEKFAKDNGCEIINILDKNSPFYQTGPSEFLYLEKNAFLICTDSFHSCVFAILYERPFIIFEREDNLVKMNSRLDTLLSKFKLSDKKYEGKISKDNVNCDYEEAFKILEIERQKTNRFLQKALDIK